MNKKFYFLLIAVLMIASQNGFASFPVKEKAKIENLSTVELQDGKATFDKKVKVQTLKASEIQPAYESPAAGGGKSQLIALILVIFVGGLGIHRFYLGYTSIGIIQLLTLGGCGIWALIDLVRIATGDLKPKGGDYAEKL